LDQLGHPVRELSPDAAPVGDAVVLQVHRGRVRPRIVSADDLDGTAVAGAVLLNDHDTVVGLLFGANTRQANHDHEVSVPFKYLGSACMTGGRGRAPDYRQARQIARPLQDTTPKYRRNRA